MICLAQGHVYSTYIKEYHHIGSFIDCCIVLYIPLYMALALTLSHPVPYLSYLPFRSLRPRGPLPPLRSRRSTGKLSSATTISPPALPPAVGPDFLSLSISTGRFISFRRLGEIGSVSPVNSSPKPDKSNLGCAANKPNQIKVFD